MAGPVAAVLLLALLVTVFANVAVTDVPRWGAEAEVAWSLEVESSLVGLVLSAGESAGSATPLSVRVPAPEPPKRLDVPILGLLDPIPTSGALAFDASCGRWDATHARTTGGNVSDLTAASRGCLAFEGVAPYTGAFVYRVEHGALLRLRGNASVVIVGPALSLEPTNGTSYLVALKLPSLRGVASSTSVGDAGIGIDLAPRGAVSEVADTHNAASVVWTLDTKHPLAWRSWFNATFLAAGFQDARAPAAGESNKDFSVVCVPADCSLASGMGRVVVTIEGPRVDRNDLRLAISHGGYDVTLR